MCERFLRSLSSSATGATATSPNENRINAQLADDADAFNVEKRLRCMTMMLVKRHRAKIEHAPRAPSIHELAEAA
jgi:hypothetical protein